VVLPSIILLFDGPLQRWRHRSLVPSFDKVNRFVIKYSKSFTVLFLVLFLPAYYFQSQTEVYYNVDQSLPADLASTVANEKLKGEFNMATTHFIIVDDSLPASKLKELCSKMEKVDGVETVLAYNKFVGPAMPEEFIPEDVKEMCKKDGKQIMMVNSSYLAARAEENAQIDELTALVKSYDPDALLTGEGVMTKDLIETCDVDIQVTNVISILAIILIVGLCFKSLTVPIVLVASIELSIFINVGISYLNGTVIPFISPIIINCIQLGATVDYAILMTTRFREELRAGRDRHDAILIAANTADEAIITSALVMFCATFGVSLVSKMEIIQSICLMLARGSIVSALVSIFILPSVLYVCEGIFAKTSIAWRTNPVPKKERRRKRSQNIRTA